MTSNNTAHRGADILIFVAPASSEHKVLDYFVKMVSDQFKTLPVINNFMFYFFQTGDDSSKLTYSVVTFSKKSSDSANSTSRSNTSDVIYSEPRVNASHSGGDPLYSTIA